MGWSQGIGGPHDNNHSTLVSVVRPPGNGKYDVGLQVRRHSLEP